MKKSWLLAKGNINKGKGQAVSFFVVILMAAMLMNIGLVTWLNYDKNYDRKATEANSADLVFIAQMLDQQTADDFMEEITKDKRTAEAEQQEVLYAGGKYDYAGGEQSGGTVFIPKEATTEIGKIQLGEVSGEKFENPIYLPYLFQTGGGYELGDTFSIRIYSATMEKVFTYQVAGFFEETFIATINSTFTGYILEHEEYQALSEAFNQELQGYLFLVQLGDRNDSEGFVTDLSGKLKNMTLGMYDSNHYEATKMARTTTSSIGAILIVAFSIIVAMVSLIIVKFWIGNSIEEDMKNIGALKALGYTNRQIVSSFLLQFDFITAAAAVVGILLSYFVLPLISGLFAAQTGISWKQPFDAVSSLITLLVLLFLVTAVAFLACRKTKRLTPIVALRSGLMTHSFKKNHFPLDGKFGSMLLRLSGKTFFQNIGQNMLVGLIIAAISFAAAFAGVLYYNIGVNDDIFIKMVAGEVPDAQIQIETTDREQALAEAKRIGQRSDVKKSYLFDVIQASLEGEMEIYCYITDDYEVYDYQGMVYEGRFPQYDNEIALNGLAAKADHKKVGDTVMMQLGDKKQEYLITGLIQGSNYMGHDACLTEEGWRRLDQDHQYPYVYAYVNEGIDVAGFLEDIEGDSANIKATVNVGDMIASSMGVYKDIVAMLAVVILAVTIAIVALTLYLVIKTNLIREKQRLGIQKAIGFTTGQLVLQSACSLLPVLLAGTVLGSILAEFQLNPLLSLLFSSIGMMKVNFEVIPALLLGLSAVITVFGFVISVMVSVRIRRITPYMLMND